MDLGAAVVKFLQHRIRDGAAHAAADHADLLLALGLGGLAQGTHKVVQTLALLLVAQLFGGGSHGLDDDGHGTLLAVIIMDSDGDTLAVLIHAQDDELARLCLFGHHGCLDLIEDHSGLERFFLDDTVHTSRLLHFVFCGGTAAVGFRSFYCIIPQRNRQLSDILNPGNKWKKPPLFRAAVSCIIWSRAANT